MKIRLFQPYSFCQIGGRSGQEDARFPDSDRPSVTQPFFLVCDGVGGQEKGELASSIVCQVFADKMSSLKWPGKFSETVFQDALSASGNALMEYCGTAAEGMATTLTFVAFSDSGCFAAHMGDSRIYQVRPGQGILYRSNDHSLVNALVHTGNITPEEAICHPDSNIITRCISASRNQNDPLRAEVMNLDDLEAGDYLILCSDGVLHKVSDAELVEILELPISDAEKINRLAIQCQDSPDNNTMILIPVECVEHEETADPDNPSEGNNTMSLHKRVGGVSEIVAQMGRTTKITPGLFERIKNIFNKNS